MYPRISINIVTWNSMEFLPDLLESLKAQTFKDFSILIIDNASNDGIEQFVREKYPEVTFLRNARNLGFSVAHNQGIRYALKKWQGENLDERFVLVTNPDIIFTSTYLENLAKSTLNKKDVGSFGGKLLRAYGDGVADEVLKETIKSDRIDSTGLRFNKNYTFTDRGAGELDEGQYELEEEVFGISGALVLYRAKALHDVRFEDEFFDVDFFAYKEDVDLAYRLQYAGWKSLYTPKAVAYHYRGVYGKEKMSFFERIKNRRRKSKKLSFYSTRNHWLLIMKNIDLVSLVVAMPRLVFSEVARVGYVIVFEQRNILVFPEVLRLVPKIFKKRKQINNSKKLSGRKIRKMFV
jgi:GT2 family glycosyltransferase